MLAQRRSRLLPQAKRLTPKDPAAQLSAHPSRADGLRVEPPSRLVLVLPCLENVACWPQTVPRTNISEDLMIYQTARKLLGFPRIAGRLSVRSIDVFIRQGGERVHRQSDSDASSAFSLIIILELPVICVHAPGADPSSDLDTQSRPLPVGAATVLQHN